MVSIVVAVLGVAFIFLPQSIQIHRSPEQVTLWEDAAIGADYMFDTGEHEIENGFSPYVKVWSLEAVTLNTSFKLTGVGFTEIFNVSDNPTEYILPGEGVWSIQISGNILEGDYVAVNAGFYYFRLIDPERVRYYPYRFFGYGMTAIGVMASLIIYAGIIKKDR